MSRSRKIAISLVCLYLILVTWQIFYEIGQNKMLRFDPDHFLYMFFGIQFGGVLDDAFSLYLFEFSLIPVIGSALAVFTKNNNSFSNYQQRSGYHGYLKTACLRAFGTGFGLAVLINIYQMIIISLFYSPFVYQNSQFFPLGQFRWRFSFTKQPCSTGFIHSHVCHRLGQFFLTYPCSWPLDQEKQPVLGKRIDHYVDLYLNSYTYNCQQWSFIDLVRYAFPAKYHVSRPVIIRECSPACQCLRSLLLDPGHPFVQVQYSL